MSLKLMFVPALLLSAAPATLVAAPQPQTHEIVRMPPGKTVMAWREVNRRTSATITCHPDPTKSVHCNGRAAELRDAAASARPEQLSER
ncbi:MAG TPA: hypothetical protein VF463_12550 [Sphingobium sp.]